MRVDPYTEADSQRWDELVQRSSRGTFLHTRRFLSYHGGRFADRSVLCSDDAGRLLAVFPAALRLDDKECVSSHPGATYGGLLLAGDDSGPEHERELLAGILRHYEERGLRRLEYKSVPAPLHSAWAQSDVQALWRLGAQLARRDVWNVAGLERHPSYTEHHQREIARALKRGLVVAVAKSDEAYADYHALLAERLDERYDVAPVHALEEMLKLRDLFPDDIALWLARDAAGRPVAGSWVFMFGEKAWHTQYIAASAEGRKTSATYALLDGLLQDAKRRGVRHLTFGSSSEDEGRRLNAGLFAFKAGFGAGAVCHDTYRLQLKA